ncbi:MAG: ECF transporter S component [Clostridiales bacterium]|jgi:riboflavin transporter FmnP|nr:ECF transporter S component [Clostridiales bacterium]
MTRLKKQIITALCVALCVVLPMAFHTIPGAGGIFLPMHIPVLLCGLICGWPFGLLCGLAGPFLSALITGMPPMAVLPGMLVELAVYGLVAGLAMRFIRTKIFYADLYLSLAAGMLTGRVAAGIAKALIFSPGSYALSAWLASSFVTALPGIAIQIILLPGIVFALEKAKLLPARYPKG